MSIYTQFNTNLKKGFKALQSLGLSPFTVQPCSVLRRESNDLVAINTHRPKAKYSNHYHRNTELEIPPRLFLIQQLFHLLFYLRLLRKRVLALLAFELNQLEMTCGLNS